MLLELVVYFALALGAATLVVLMPWAPRAGQRAGVPLGLGIVPATGWVALQIPTYNEPIDVLRPTLESLARVDYPRLVVQVVDNNTTDPSVWRPLETLCEQLGPRFRFLHLEPWPGFKAGALNEATRRLAPQVEIIGIIDADYIVEPHFLQAMVGHFDDPTVAFAQSSQNYRDWQDSSHLRGLFYTSP